jgi:hypothetical protein
MRGSIPLVWSQRPNLRWQPAPALHALDAAQQVEVFRAHFRRLQETGQAALFGGGATGGPPPNIVKINSNFWSLFFGPFYSEKLFFKYF